MFSRGFRTACSVSSRRVGFVHGAQTHRSTLRLHPIPGQLPFSPQSRGRVINQAAAPTLQMRVVNTRFPSLPRSSPWLTLLSFCLPLKNKIPRYFRASKTVSCLAFSRDGGMLAVGEKGHHASVTVWSLAKGVVLRELTGGQYFGIRCVAFTPSGGGLVTMGFKNDRMLRVRGGAMRMCSPRFCRKRKHCMSAPMASKMLYGWACSKGLTLHYCIFTVAGGGG